MAAFCSGSVAVKDVVNSPTAFAQCQSSPQNQMEWQDCANSDLEVPVGATDGA
jgi:hypothetical protein